MKKTLIKVLLLSLVLVMVFGTVSASAAESLRGKIALPKVSRYSCFISESSIEDGTVTFTATYNRPAFTISIR